MPTLRIIHFALLTIIFSFAVSSKNEWTPIPIEDIYRRLRVNIQKPNNMYDIDSSWTSNVELTTENDDVLKSDVIKLVEPQMLYSDFVVKRFGLPQMMSKDEKKSNEDNTVSSSSAIQDETDYISTQVKTKSSEEKEIKQGDDKSNIKLLPIETSTEISVRKAKKIDTTDFVSEFPDNFVNSKEQNVNIESKYTIKQNIPSATQSLKEDNVRSYEVTENSEIKDFFYPETNNIIRSGYIYKAPVANKMVSNSNITGMFLDILDKYKIHKNDNLQNYAKSRIASVQKSVPPQVIYLPLPLKVLHRYNSLNHLPVDPMLAVLLSNYGIYLPYSYGLHNNYRNLYGYLASNNIHNNLPFGPYKVFADTDSSSK
ncbi:uncharacterized protein LOC126370256 [Pectinophora gossypiella]|uniref:uncharacterized protein LOC126370256 n=1 Tax=Pectinophora gossypiella TaxID=13191 RepID=UPI00214EC529|nr:uncharacterized protein LOC126370256 [Pectinophora gossypiella]